MAQIDTNIKWHEAKVTDARLLPGLRSGEPVYTAKDTTAKWLMFARSAWYALTPEEAKVSLLRWDPRSGVSVPLLLSAA